MRDGDHRQRHPRSNALKNSEELICGVICEKKPQVGSPRYNKIAALEPVMTKKAALKSNQVPRCVRIKVAYHAGVDERTFSTFLDGKCSPTSAHKIAEALRTLQLTHLTPPRFWA